jgi:hypothetical protein
MKGKAFTKGNSKGGGTSGIGLCKEERDNGILGMREELWEVEAGQITQGARAIGRFQTSVVKLGYTGTGSNGLNWGVGRGGGSFQNVPDRTTCCTWGAPTIPSQQSTQAPKATGAKYPRTLTGWVPRCVGSAAF